MPGYHAVALLGVTVAAFYLYTRPWIRIEIVSLLLLLTLLVFFYLLPYSRGIARLTEVEIFQVFGHPALIAICCLMVLGRGLTMTGALEPAVRLLGRLWALSRWLGLLVTLIVAGAASAFINDTPVVVLLLPLLLGLSRRTGHPASKMLMPVNFAVLTGGMLTSIGTSTNILVLRIAEDFGMKPVGLFDFSTTALAAFALAVPYLWLIAPRLLPDTGRTRADSTRIYEARLQVSAGNSRLVGRKMEDLTRELGRPFPAIGLMRDGREATFDAAGAFAVGDAVLLSDTPEGLREVASTFGVDLSDRHVVGRFGERDISLSDTHLAEVVVGSGSPLSGKTLRETRFEEQNEVAVVGCNRGSGGLLHNVHDLADAPLGAGYVLLVQGPADRVERLRAMPNLMVLDMSLVVPRSPRAPLALAIIAAVMIVAATKLLPIHVAAFMGVIAMLLSGCVRLEGVGQALSLEVVLLIASSIALGQSLVTTGAAGWVAQGVAAVVQHLSPAVQLALFMGFAAVLTNFVSNAAAATVGTPIAAATALQLGVPLEPFVFAILFGSNLSYATPIAYQTNLLIMKAAGYRFTDFVRVGVPLVILMLAALSVLLVRRYGL